MRLVSSALLGLVLLFSLAFGGCAKTGDGTGGAQVEPSVQLIAALNAAGASAPGWRALAASNGNTEACAAWAGVAMLAPALADVLTQASSGERPASTPALSGDASMCALEGLDIDADAVTLYVQAAFATAFALVDAYKVQLEGDSCAVFTVARGIAGASADLVVGVIDMLSGGTWQLAVGEHVFDYAGCDAEG